MRRRGLKLKRSGLLVVVALIGSGCTRLIAQTPAEVQVQNNLDSGGTAFTSFSVSVPTNNEVWNGNIFAAFQAAGTPPPSITSLSPTSGQVGTSVTVRGTNFG